MDPIHNLSPPKFIFFVNELPDSDSTHTTGICFYNIWEIAKYNSKLFSENVEIIHIEDTEKISNYTFNKKPQPYKTFVKLVDDADEGNNAGVDPRIGQYYVLEEDYHIERFEHDRNQLIKLLGKLNAKSVYFSETINSNCGDMLLGSIFSVNASVNSEKKKMEEMLQRSLFDDKELTEAQIHEEFQDFEKYPAALREVISNRFSGVSVDNYSFSCNDYHNISSKLTDSLNAYLGIQCNSQSSSKITYEYMITYHPYKKRVTFENEEKHKTAKKTICNHYPFFCGKHGIEKQIKE